MTEKCSHDVNVTLFKCVTGLLKLLGVGRVLFKPKDVFTLCRCYDVSYLFKSSYFEMQQFDNCDLMTYWKVAMCM